MKNLSKLLIGIVFVVSMILPVSAANLQKDVPMGVIQGTVLEITQTEQSTMVSIKGKSMSENGVHEIVLHLFEMTQIKDKNKKDLTISDIKVGAKVEATFGPAMTMSLPPQSKAHSITVLSPSSIQGLFISIRQLLQDLF